jgi:hypothetical protein
MKNNQVLYKFREIDKFAIDILVNKRLHLSSWAILNDPHEAEMYIETENCNIHANPQKLQYLDKQLFNKGFIDDNLISPKICSLSSIWSSNLLWSHYTAGHSGIAIGVTLPILDQSIKELIVKYDDKVPTIKRYPLKKEDILKALTHKSKEWKYEKEVRLVTFEPERAYIENVEIKEINFGLRTSEDDIRLIFSILKNTGVKFFKTCLKPGSYNLNKADIPWLQKAG